MCFLLKETHRQQLVSPASPHQSQAPRSRVCLFLLCPLISAQALLSTPFPIIGEWATTCVLVCCGLTRRIHTIVYLALGTIHRSAKVSLRMLCRLYSPSKTSSFLRPPLPSRWMRCPSSKNRWISILISFFQFRLWWWPGIWRDATIKAELHADGMIVQAGKDFWCGWILRVWNAVLFTKNPLWHN